MERFAGEFKNIEIAPQEKVSILKEILDNLNSENFFNYIAKTKNKEVADTLKDFLNNYLNYLIKQVKEYPDSPHYQKLKEAIISPEGVSKLPLRIFIQILNHPPKILEKEEKENLKTLVSLILKILNFIKDDEVKRYLEGGEIYDYESYINQLSIFLGRG